MKIQGTYTIDEDLPELIEEESYKQERSKSFIVNKILRKHYNKTKK